MWQNLARPVSLLLSSVGMLIEHVAQVFVVQLQWPRNRSDGQRAGGGAEANSPRVWQNSEFGKAGVDHPAAGHWVPSIHLTGMVQKCLQALKTQVCGNAIAITPPQVCDNASITPPGANKTPQRSCPAVSHLVPTAVQLPQIAPGICRGAKETQYCWPVDSIAADIQLGWWGVQHSQLLGFGSSSNFCTSHSAS